MSPLSPWLGLWANSIAAGRGALDFVERVISAGEIGKARAPDRRRDWASPNEVILELPTMRLRMFTAAASGPPAIVVAPYALHGATTADFAHGHSVVEALLAGGVGRVLVTEWRSAGPEQGHIGIDACLADLNVAVDEIGSPAAIAGLCHGGWLAAVYAARFPAKVSRLALAGAPLDVDAAPSVVRDLVRGTSPDAIREMIALGDGVMPGQVTQSTWPTPEPDPQEIARTLQLRTASPALAVRFLRWNDDIVDLPGTFYIETSERIFRHNLLAAGAYPALGRTVGLGDIACPVHLLAARGDTIVPPAQLLALADRQTLRGKTTARIVDGSHLSLFMGRMTVRREWAWIAAFVAGATLGDASPDRRTKGARACAKPGRAPAHQARNAQVQTLAASVASRLNSNPDEQEPLFEDGLKCPR